MYIRQITMSGINTCFSIMTLMVTRLPLLDDLKYWQSLPVRVKNQTWVFPNSASKGLIWVTLHIILSLWKFIMHIRILKTQKILTVKKHWILFNLVFSKFIWHFVFHSNLHFASWKRLLWQPSLLKLLKGEWVVWKKISRYSTISHPFPGFKKCPKKKILNIITCFVHRCILKTH